MQIPAMNRRLDSGVQFVFARAPIFPTAFAAAEDEIPQGPVSINPPRLRRQDSEGGRGQGDLMRAAVLGALARQRDQSLVEVDFGPAQGGDFFAAAAGQDQQADDRAVGVGILGGVPDCRQLVVGDDTGAGRALDRLIGLPKPDWPRRSPRGSARRKSPTTRRACGWRRRGRTSRRFRLAGPRSCGGRSPRRRGHAAAWRALRNGGASP